MPMLRTLVRVFAAAVSAALMLAPGTSFAATNTYTCDPTSFSVGPTTTTGGTSALSVSCTDPSGGTSPSPGVCAITPAIISLTSSSSSTTVSQGFTANSYCGAVSNWTVTGTGGTFSTTSGSSTTLTLPAIATGGSPAPYTVTVTGSSSGTPTSATASVTVNPVPAAPPPGTTISCSGYSTQVVSIPWGAIGSGNVRVTTRGFTNGMIVVGSFTTPNVTIPATSVVRAKISSAESSSQTGPILRTAAFSDTPCVFPSPNPMGMFSTVTGSTSPSVTYQVNGTSNYYPILRPNTTYYFNIKNENNGSPTCPAQFGSCDMYIELSKPTGW